MDIEKSSPPTTMAQRIYDRAYDELRLLRASLQTRPDNGFSDEFRSDVFRKHELLLSASDNLGNERKPTGIEYQKFTDLNEWAGTVLNSFVPDQSHGITPSENPQVPVLKTKIPLDVRYDFDNAMINAQIKKAYVDNKLEAHALDKKQLRDVRSDVLRLKDELSDSFDKIAAQDSGHWNNFSEVSDEYINTLKLLGGITQSLNDEEKAQPLGLVP